MKWSPSGSRKTCVLCFSRRNALEWTIRSRSRSNDGAVGVRRLRRGRGRGSRRPAWRPGASSMRSAASRRSRVRRMNAASDARSSRADDAAARCTRSCAAVDGGAEAVRGAHPGGPGRGRSGAARPGARSCTIGRTCPSSSPSRRPSRSTGPPRSSRSTPTRPAWRTCSRSWWTRSCASRRCGMRVEERVGTARGRGAAAPSSSSCATRAGRASRPAEQRPAEPRLPHLGQRRPGRDHLRRPGRARQRAPGPARPVGARTPASRASPRSTSPGRRSRRAASWTRWSTPTG